MYKYTGKEIYLLSDREYGCGFNGEKVHTTIERDIDGGLSFSSTRMEKSYNLREEPNYDPNQDSVYINYFDETSLYPTTCAKYPMPEETLRVDNDITFEQIMNTSEDAKVGYFVNCDMYVPDELHDYFSDYPPMIGHYNVQDDMLTPIQLRKRKNWVSIIVSAKNC